MTLISRLGYKPKKTKAISSGLLQNTKDITIVIPVKNNQNGIDLFLNEFLKSHSFDSFPKEIIIVDNNSYPAITVKNEKYPIPVTLLVCCKTGPAAARNAGAKHARTDWLLFTDSDCIPTDTLLTGYFKAQNGSIGYAGNVKSYSRDFISKYYEQQEILIPPKVYEESKKSRPDYLVTANCLVWRKAFEEVGGFNEKIKIAGGEDIDLGFKFLNIGQLSYAFESIAKHNFNDGLSGFKERFIRYGYGNKIIGHYYNLDLKPTLFKPNHKSPINYVLAFLQYFWLLKGFKKPIGN